VNSVKKIRSDRSFRVWDYRASHDQLLIRSPKGGTNSRNQDVIFTGVEYFSLPTRLDGLEVAPVSSTEIPDATRGYGKKIAPERVLAIRSGGQRHLVIAASVREEENDLDLFESSLETFSA
jgi:hypothetical protein